MNNGPSAISTDDEPNDASDALRAIVRLLAKAVAQRIASDGNDHRGQPPKIPLKRAPDNRPIKRHDDR